MARKKLPTLTVETDLEVDGRWIAEVLELPGVLTYAPTRAIAVLRVLTLAGQVLADQIEHGER